MRSLHRRCAALSLALGASLAAQTRLEMGKMWTFENPPLAYLEKEYGFKPDQRWLNSLRLAALRFGNGCSASFVSPKGLIMTNHHCVRGQIAAAQGDANWIRDSFVASSLAEEVPLKDLTVQQLISTRAVTDEMTAGIGADDDEATIARKLEDNKKKITAAATAAHPGLSPQVITMHNGATYQLYLYRIYDDVRLVCAPHLQTSHFGGDPDNFTYPRYSIDFAFCRAYTGGKPADTTAHYFRWSRRGPKQGELAFVVGNPGSTGRLQTLGQMAYEREARWPIWLDQLDAELPIYKEHAATDPDFEKRNKASILRMENTQKAIGGFLDGLRDPTIHRAKSEAEAGFRGRITGDAQLNERFGSAWDELEAINKEKIALAPRQTFYRPSPHSVAMQRAAALVQATDESLSDEARTAARKRATAPPRPDPVGPRLLVAHLERTLKWLGSNDPLVRLLLGEETPAQAAIRIEQSRVTDDEAARALLAGGRAALESSGDKVIQAALLIDEVTRKVTARVTELTALEQRHATRIGQALYAAYGDNVSPDATLSLRFSDGRVQGYRYNGTLAPFRTTFYGLYARNTEFDNRYPFDLPKIWLDRIDRIDMSKGVNFVATNDIIGGNSGSPIVNKDLEVIGLIFDGNIELLGNRYIYRDDTPRSVSVHSEAILEACAKIYDAQWIVDELRR